VFTSPPAGSHLVASWSLSVVVAGQGSLPSNASTIPTRPPRVLLVDVSGAFNGTHTSLSVVVRVFCYPRLPPPPPSPACLPPLCSLITARTLAQPPLLRISVPLPSLPSPWWHQGTDFGEVLSTCASDAAVAVNGAPCSQLTMKTVIPILQHVASALRCVSQCHYKPLVLTPPPLHTHALPSSPFPP
jgi:hypothetical protein